MQYKYLIDQEHHCVFFQQFGEVSFDQLWEQEAQLPKDPGYVAGMNLLRDFTQATLGPRYDTVTVKRKAHERLNRGYGPLGNNRKVAWVLNNAEDFKIFHQFCAFASLNHTVISRHPFRNVSKALAWLGLPEDYEMSYPDPLIS